MSWMKRPRASPGANQGPGHNIFNPTQPPMPGQQQQQQWSQQHPMAHPQQPQQPNNYPQQQQQMPPVQQQYWQQNPQAQQQNMYNDPQQQNYPQQPQSQPQQNFATSDYFQYNQQYGHQQGYQNYQQQQPANAQQQQPAIAQQHNVQQVNQQQSWEPEKQKSNDAWDWGWQDDSANAQQQNASQQGQPGQAMQTNANIIANSFSNSGDSWNWSIDDQQQQHSQQTVEDYNRKSQTPHSREASQDTVVQKNLHAPSPRPQQNAVATEQQVFVQNDNNVPVPSNDSSSNFESQIAPNVPHLPISEPNIKSLSDKGALLEHNNSLPNMAVMNKSRRYLNDTLTPQWSTESQPSQDSSDGLLTESTTNRSEDPSTKSSPSFSQDNTNFNYPQNVDNVSDNLWDHSNKPFDNVQVNERDNVANHELVDGVRGLSLNRSTASPNHAGVHQPSDNLIPPNVATPPLDRNSPNIPHLPPSNKKAPQLPPNVLFLPQSSGGNPFKRTGPHKSNNRIPVMGDNAPSQPLDVSQVYNQNQEHPAQVIQNVRQPSPGLQSLPLSSPRIVQQQNYATANLETTPDNSERPDIPAPVNYRPMQFPTHGAEVVQSAVENFEIAPSNDRDEYLQTRHLSDVSFDNTNFADDIGHSGNVSQESFPPPGLRRMVLGQPESEFSQNSNDEPPPGLSRMVPGQLNDSNNMYAQPNDDFLDRQIDGQTTESESLNSSYMNRTPNVYNRVGDGQPTDDESNYNPNSSRSASDRRPIGLDRMVPGESSSYQGFQSQNFSNDQRVVTGIDQNAGSERRDQNMDGSDYSEIDTTSQVRSIVGVETVDDRNVNQDNVAIHAPVNDVELNQREINMEGENLQDLSTISSTDFSFVRDQNMDGADTRDEPINIPAESEASSHQMQPRKDSKSDDRKYHDDTTGDDSDRDRYNRKSKKDKDRMRSSRERDGRYGSDKRDDRKERDRRGGDSLGRERDRDDDRPYRRSNRDARYETEDTDYYSDRERRRYREGSYTSSSKPPRPEDGRRSYDRSLRDPDRESGRRHRGNKDESYESERDGYNSAARKRGDKDRGYDDRDSRRYRDERKNDGYSSLRKSKPRDDRKRDSRYPPRPDSRDPDPMEDDDPSNDPSGSMSLDRRGRSRHSTERDARGHRRDKRDRDHRERDRYNAQYYDSRYGGYGMDPYAQQVYQQQQQTYQYYEKLRLTNPQAYMDIYAKYIAGQRLPGYGDAYASMPGYDQASNSRLADERGSVHSGQSSTNGEALKDRMLLDTSLGGGTNAGNSNYFYPIRSEGYMRHNAPLGHRRMGSSSMRTDISDSRDYNTDSIHFGMENSTVKSERMTPVKFATAHIKGVISCMNLVTVNPSYPMDGQPAVVEILDLNKILSNDAVRCELTTYPGPLIKGTTHKKTVIEYCEMKIREAIEKNSYGERGGFYPKHHPMINSGNSNSLSERQTLSSSSNLPNNADIASYVLMWELLILLLRQNGMVVGTDIAELLVKNKQQFGWRGAGSAPPTAAKSLSRRGSNSSVTSRSNEMPIEEVMPAQENSGTLEAEDSSTDGVQSKQQTARSSSQQKMVSQSGSGNVRRASSHNILESPAHEKYVTDKFREYLLFGNGKEALEWAMSHSLWGHALFLASKLDKRTYANVMMRFANGLAANDPLQTLYQLMSGRQPASVTCVLDDKWGDWRPHLAMILSNTTQRPDLDKRSITTLGDTLLSRGDVYAAHFCYLMSREEPSSTPGSRLQLLGLPLNVGNNNPYKSPSHNIIMTEIYEYACSLNQTQRAMGHFQFYKYLLATRLVDCGLYERALVYLESIAETVVLEPHQYQGPFLQRVLNLADRLKYYDPEENVGDLSLEDQHDSLMYGSGGDPVQTPGSSGNKGSGDKAWLSNLRTTVTQIMSDPSSHAPSYTASQYDYQMQQQQQNYYQQPLSHTAPNLMDNDWTSQQSHSIQQQNINNNNSSNYDQLQDAYQQQQQQQQNSSKYDQQQQQHGGEAMTMGENNGQDNFNNPQMYDPNALQQNNFLSPVYGKQDSRDDSGDTNDFTSGTLSQSENLSPYYQDQHQYGYHEPDTSKEQSVSETINRESHDALEPPRPQISMPNASNRSNRYDDSEKEQDDDRTMAQTKGSQSQQQPKVDKKDSNAVAKTQPSSGWFGGIFNKLSLKPKNQMILPDDKNPSIVWDSEKKKWVNLDSDEQEREAQLAPPPKMSDIVRTTPNINNNIPPPAVTPDAMMGGVQNTSTPVPPSNMPNIFKLQKSRHIKKAYVDVFNPSGAPMKPLAPASEVLGDPMMMGTPGQPMTYFVPGPGATTPDQGSPYN